MKASKNRTKNKGDDYEKVKNLCEIKKNRKQLCARRIHFCECGEVHDTVSRVFKSVFHCARKRSDLKQDSKVSELDITTVTQSEELVH